MVEMAIVLPILLTMFFAIAEFSILFLRWQSVTNAAREGAREASLFRPSCGSVASDVDAVVANALGATGLTASNVDVSGDCREIGSERSTVSVSVQYQFRILPNFVTQISGGPIDLNATSVMRNEFADIVAGG